MHSVNLLDAGLVLILVLFTLRGLLRGMVHEVAGLIGIFLGFFVSGRYYTKAVPFASSIVSSSGWVNIVAYALVFLAVVLCVAVFAYALRTFMKLTFTAWLDHALGGLAGASKGLLLCAVILALLRHFLPTVPLLVESKLAGHLDSVIAFVRSLIPVQYNNLP